MKKMLVVDGNSIINRAFYGVRPLTTSYGLHTNAVYGMINILDRHISELSPDYCAIAFDLKAPTFRHKMYSEYKAGRRGMPDELAEQFGVAKEVAEALGFMRLECEGYEADDILGTLSKYADEDTTVYILTGDRDSLQLINDNVHVLLATNSETVDFDRAMFREKYGIDPTQFVDVKALMGDTSDNIPGVRGIGEKTAFSLIAQYGTLDNVYASLDTAKLTNCVRTRLGDGKDAAYMSRDLAKIFTEVPISASLNDMEYHGMDRARTFELMQKLEFSAFIKRFGLNAERNIGAQNTGSEEKYSFEDGDAKCEMLQRTEGLFAISFKDNAVTLFDGSTAVRFSDITKCADELCKFLSCGENRIVCYDCKALYKFLDGYGIKFRDADFDVMLAAYVINSGNGSYDISRIVIEYPGRSYNDDIDTAVYAFELYPLLCERLQRDGLEKLMYEIEMPLASVLTDMELYGFKIDPNGIRTYGDELLSLAKEYESRIFVQAGETFNINSPKQLGEVLFEKLHLKGGKKTKTGYSTSADVLEKLRSVYPIVDDILEYRKVTKLKSTYVDGLLREADKNGRVHTNFKQTGTATGRLSSTEPNLQNIPIRTELGRLLRRFFIPESAEYVLIDADYSQIELRLLAHISGDETMIESFKSGKDIHASTASRVFGVPESEVSAEMRKHAKVINFGILYGMGEFTLANDLHISRAEAKEYINSYLSGFPRVDEYLKNIIKSAYENKYVTTMYSRRRYIPELAGQNKMLRSFGERVAMNSPIQGSAADIIKIAMINVHQRLKKEGLDARLILQVHDELLIEASKKDAERARRVLCEEMESVASLSIPLTVEVEMGDNWLFE